MGEMQVVDVTAHMVLQRRDHGTQSRLYCTGIAAAFEGLDLARQAWSMDMGSHEAGRIGAESDNDGRRCSEDVLDYLCGQREDRRGRRRRNGRLKVTKWSGTCQGILFAEKRSGVENGCSSHKTTGSQRAEEPEWTALYAWDDGANPIAVAQVHNLESQGTPANRGVFRPASWIYGVLLWQLPARNTLESARVAARIFRRQPPLSRAQSRRPPAVLAARAIRRPPAAVPASTCAATCNERRLAAWLLAARCAHRYVMPAVASQRVRPWLLARGDYPR
ncbi:hypothetical protein SVAN01_01811 [Stagonosporopsis vannaccii]|nr:hypothetical protein SVAN01_01811 [Stagonosporopsis vannaccii]